MDGLPVPPVPVGRGPRLPTIVPADWQALCHARQSGHFLEIALLHPPPAALRRFPRRKTGFVYK